jgi:hypothetical protein
MKIVELTNKVLLPITNEEHEVLEQFVDDISIAKNQFNEREQLLANSLTNKDVLLRTNQDGKIHYKKRIN